MSKQITIPYNGTNYTLTFTKRTLDAAANSGVNTSGLADNPFKIVRLFHAACMKNHPKMTYNQAQQIYMAQNGKEKLITCLIALWNDVANSVVDDADESGNIEWVANFEIEGESQTTPNSEEE